MSEQMEYVRLCDGLNDHGKLYPPDKVSALIVNNRDFYVSMFKYTQEHYEQFQKSGSISGITNVLTNVIVADFDAEVLENALAEAKIYVKRLIEAGVPERSILEYFSGCKGIHVVFKVKIPMTPAEVKNICLNLGADLDTLDTKIYNASRVLRVVNTLHPKSYKYKIQIPSDKFLTVTMDKIIEMSNKVQPYTEVEAIDLPEKLKLIKANVTPMELKVLGNFKQLELKDMVANLDWSKKISKLPPEKHALYMGVIEPGSRNDGFLIVAASLFSLGIKDPNDLHLELKKVAHRQSILFNSEPFSKKEIWQIVQTVTGSNWKGGTFSSDTNDMLKRILMLIPPGILLKKDADISDVTGCIASFIRYAGDYHNNIISFGLKDFDKRFKAQRGHLIGILAPPGAGKCHGIGTPIMMFDGTVKNVENVKIGDLLMGDDSTPRTVLSLARGREQLYNIKQENGDDYVVNESHILSLKGASSLKCSYSHDKVFDVPLIEYIASNRHYKRRVKGYKVAVDFEKKNLPLDPYVFGVWIAEETTSSSDQVFTASITGVSTNTFLKYLQSSNLIKGKYIPHEFLTSSRADRLELAGGILDGDGCFCPIKNTFELTSSSDSLSDQYVYLFRSLGYKVTKASEMKKYKSFTEGNYIGESLAHRLYITGDNLHEIKTKLVSKTDTAQNKQRFQDLTEIEVEKLEVGDYYGFEISGNHRYLLGDFTVTHNTSFLLAILNNTSKSGVHSIFFSYDMAKDILFQKLIQKETGYDSDKVYQIFGDKDADEIAKIQKLLEASYKNVSFCFKTGQTIEQMKETILEREQALGVDIALVGVDYLELVQTNFSDPTQSSAAAIQGLREISNNMNKAVICLLQPNKVNSKPDEPLLSYNAVKGSSSIAQACTAIITAHRPGNTSRTTEDDNFFCIDVVKNRMGPLMAADFHWSGLRGEIRDLTPDEKYQLADLRERKKNDKAEERNGDTW